MKRNEIIRDKDYSIKLDISGISSQKAPKILISEYALNVIRMP